MIFKGTKGFTLIEIMVVIAVIGSIAAIAIVRYQDFVIKTQVTSLVKDAASLKAIVGVCIAENRLIIGRVTSDNDSTTCDSGIVSSPLMHHDDLSQTGIVSATVGGFTQVVLLEGGRASLAARFGDNVNIQLKGTGVVWTRNSQGDWQCAMGIVIPGVAGVSLATVVPTISIKKAYAQPLCPAI